MNSKFSRHSAEQYAIASAVMDERARATLVAEVDPTDFENHAFRCCLVVMRKLMSEGRDVDLFTIHEGISRIYPNTDAIVEISNTVDLMPNPALIDEYIRSMIDASTRRKLRSVAVDLIERLEDTDELERIADGAASNIMLVSGRLSQEDSLSVGDIGSKQVELFSYQSQGRIMTPWQAINIDTAGFEGDQLIIVGARPGVGKTAIALQLALNVADVQGKGVLFVSAEMSKQQVWRRLVHQELGISPIRQALNNLTLDERTAVAGMASHFQDEKIGLYIMDSGDMSFASIYARAKAMHITGNLGLVVVDYLQILDTTASENRTLEIARLTKGLKRMSRILGVPVVALSQLNREVERSESSRQPRLSDLRESGAIEQDADVVLLIHRKTEGLDSETTNSLILLAKQRMGPTARYKATYGLDNGKFYNLVRQ